MKFSWTQIWDTDSIKQDSDLINQPLIDYKQ